MDTSETYIKMRRMAKSDLKDGIPIECPCNYISLSDVWIDSKGDFYFGTEDEVFQLERQDQLQEMVEYDWVVCVKRVYDFMFSLNPPEMPHSMEQLWLAFVMKEKYNKVWNGTEWIKEG